MDRQQKEGERDGLTKQFYSDTGKLRVSGNYKNGVRDGEFKAYYPNGNLQGEVTYKDGEMNGLKEDFYKNGNVWTRQEFKNNDLDGVYEVYYENGNPQLKAKIKNGQTIEEQRFNYDGTLYNEQDEKIVESNDEIIILEIL